MIYLGAYRDFFELFSSNVRSNPSGKLVLLRKVGRLSLLSDAGDDILLFTDSCKNRKLDIPI